jgi:hypothetical protein
MQQMRWAIASASLCVSSWIGVAVATDRIETRIAVGYEFWSMQYY